MEKLDQMTAASQPGSTKATKDLFDRRALLVNCERWCGHRSTCRHEWNGCTGMDEDAGLPCRTAGRFRKNNLCLQLLGIPPVIVEP